MDMGLTMDCYRGLGFRVYGPGTYHGLLQRGRIYILWTWDLQWTILEEQDLEFLDLGLIWTTIEGQDLEFRTWDLLQDYYMWVGFKVY